MSLPKPDWGKTFTVCEGCERIITHSALVAAPGMSGAFVRLWMEECWTMQDGERRLRDERTCYWHTDRAHAYATLEKCLEEAGQAAERGEISTWARDEEGRPVPFNQPVTADTA